MARQELALQQQTGNMAFKAWRGKSWRCSSNQVSHIPLLESQAELASMSPMEENSTPAREHGALAQQGLDRSPERAGLSTIPPQSSPQVRASWAPSRPFETSLSP
jgi:hypothetical protein